MSQHVADLQGVRNWLLRNGHPELAMKLDDITAEILRLYVLNRRLPRLTAAEVELLHGSIHILINKGIVSEEEEEQLTGTLEKLQAKSGELFCPNHPDKAVYYNKRVCEACYRRQKRNDDRISA